MTRQLLALLSTLSLMYVIGGCSTKSRTKWEYKHHSDVVEARMEARLNLAAEGWEFVTLAIERNSSGTQYHVSEAEIAIAYNTIVVPALLAHMAPRERET